MIIWWVIVNIIISLHSKVTGGKYKEGKDFKPNISCFRLLSHLSRTFLMCKPVLLLCEFYLMRSNLLVLQKKLRDEGVFEDIKFKFSENNPPVSYGWLYNLVLTKLLGLLHIQIRANATSYDFHKQLSNSYTPSVFSVWRQKSTQLRVLFCCTPPSFSSHLPNFSSYFSFYCATFFCVLSFSNINVEMWHSKK